MAPSNEYLHPHLGRLAQDQRHHLQWTRLDHQRNQSLRFEGQGRSRLPLRPQVLLHAQSHHQIKTQLPRHQLRRVLTRHLQRSINIKRRSSQIGGGSISRWLRNESKSSVHLRQRGVLARGQLPSKSSRLSTRLCYGRPTQRDSWEKMPVVQGTISMCMCISVQVLISAAKKQA